MVNSLMYAHSSAFSIMGESSPWHSTFAVSLQQCFMIKLSRKGRSIVLLGVEQNRGRQRHRVRNSRA